MALWCAGTFTRPWCNVMLHTQCVRLASRSERVAIPSAIVRHASPRGGIRHSDDSAAPGAPGRANDDDLHARHEEGFVGGAESRRWAGVTDIPFDHRVVLARVHTLLQSTPMA